MRLSQIANKEWGKKSRKENARLRNLDDQDERADISEQVRDLQAEDDFDYHYRSN